MKDLTPNVSSKEFLACLFVALIVAFMGSAVLYQGASSALREESRQKLTAIAANASLLVDADLHSNIRTRADESSDAYRQIRMALKSARRVNPDIRYVYTMRKTNRKNILQFVVDSDDDPDHVGSEYDASRFPEMQKAFRAPTADMYPERDKWGTWLSGYAPIKDSQGRVDAIIGVDMSVAQLRAQESALRRSAIRNVIVTMLTALLLASLATRLLLAPIRKLKSAVTRIREGDLDFQVGLRDSGEMQEFARSFDCMIVALKENRERLMEQITHDPLTRLYNHRHFHERLQFEVERAKRHDRKLSLIFLDLDRFKSINDTLGHPVGDSVLFQLAEVIQQSVRSVDLPCRYGGDEFAIILPETDAATGQQVAERLRSQVEKHTFYALPIEELESIESKDLKEIGLHVTVTIGVAVYPDHYKSRDGLVVAADIALCQAKHVARNTVFLFNPDIEKDTHLDLEELYAILREPNTDAVKSLVDVVDARERYTYGHSERVARYAVEIGESMRLDVNTVNQLKIASLLHDIGKMEVADHILSKSGSLTTSERMLMNEHPVLGSEMLRRASSTDQAIPVVLHHHERYDGSGYPSGLAGNDIPILARILCVADSFDAMISDRPYRRAMTVQAALFELKANAGTQFDPDVVEAFVKKMTAKNDIP